MSLAGTLAFSLKESLFTLKRFLPIVQSIRFENIYKIGKMSTSRESKYNWSVSLVCPNGNHEPIDLPHLEPLYLGRCPETRIVDPRCSRKQIKLYSNLMTGEIQVTQTGSNSSVLDGMEMIKDKVYGMRHSSTLHVLAGLYPQKLHVKHLEDLEKTESRKSNHNHSLHDNDQMREKKRKTSPTSEQKSGTKRKSSSDDSHDAVSKRPKMLEKELDRKQKHKDKSKDKHTERSGKKDSKKTENSSVNTNKHETKKDREASVESEEKYLSDVSEKLKILKAAAAKDLKTPTKEGKLSSESKSFKIPESRDNGGPGQSKKGAATSSRWDQYDSLYIYTSKGLEGRSRIAGFDIDGTIIETQSGKKFPTHPGDWRMKFSNQISKKIRKHYEDGYKIVFFTNQMGVSRGKTNIADLKVKFSDVVEEINVPIQVLVSTKSGLYRKPCTGMWDFLVEKGNDGVPIELSQSFYVGDAAGRPDKWAPKKKKDFSCSDRLFALNIGIEFKTPEEFFMGYPVSKYQLPQFDPRKLSSKTPLLDPADARLTSKEQEVIVLAGSPASGKSFFSQKYLVPKGYAYVNRDTLGTWQKCVTACKDYLKQGKSVVIDNTNPDFESRQRFLKVASSLNVPCRCFIFNITIEQARHNERFREITDKSHQPINDIIMNSFKGKFKPPELSEGFTEIVKVNFVPKFRDEAKERLYRMFLMEK